AEEFLRNAPTIMWHGHLIANPAYELPEEAFDIVDDGEGFAIRINSDSYWDNLPQEQRPFYVKHADIPVALSEAVALGASRVGDGARLPKAAFDLLARVAGVGSIAEPGDKITERPKVIARSVSADSPHGLVEYSFTLPCALLTAHTAVTGAALGTAKAGTPDALVGPCWPAIYTALGTGRLTEEHGEPAGTDFPVIEGLLNAVHLDHVVDVRVPLHEL